MAGLGRRQFVLISSGPAPSQKAVSADFAVKQEKGDKGQAEG
jgi:hypothetical protein